MAADSHRLFADGVRFLELGDLREGALLTYVVVTELSLHHPAPKGIGALLVDHLRGKKLLLVLDNRSRWSTRPRPCRPRFTYMREVADCGHHTSREVLGVNGEAVLRVLPLTSSDSASTVTRSERVGDVLTLFAVRTGLGVTRIRARRDQHSARCTAASSMASRWGSNWRRRDSRRWLSNSCISASPTGTSCSLKTAAARRADNRHYGCPSTGATSCVPATEQVAWQQLSAFPGSFDPDAAEQVCRSAAGTGCLDALASLVVKSILNREEFGAALRFRLLDTATVRPCPCE